MATVINSSNKNFIDHPIAYNGWNNKLEVGGFFGIGGTKLKMSDCTNIKIMDDENHLGTSGSGKAVGGALGGLAFGGAGAVVGAMMGGGNKIKKIKKLALEFGKTWFIIEFEDGLVDNVIRDGIIKNANVEQESPFAKA